MYVVYVLCLVFLCLFGVVWFANVEKIQIGGIGWVKMFCFCWRVETRRATSLHIICFTVF